MATALHSRIGEITERLEKRSYEKRQRYLDKIEAAIARGPHRSALSCSNLAHGFAACGSGEKADLAGEDKPNIAIISAYNDMLSAHQPLETYPALIKQACRDAGGIAQFAGGVPAMCDGVTQGQPGMELSLISRDVIAMATAVALSHDMFDGALYLGVCDKIVPGLVIAALSFGHLPAIFVPAGPMTSGLPNDEKAKIRQMFAEGLVGRDTLLEAESRSYHGPGTCTFYGTANTNQMLMEIMGLHLPGASFVNPGTPMRDALTKAAARRVTEITALGNQHRPMGRMINEKAIINGVIGLHATGGSTNHTLHIVAMAQAAGIALTWDDMADLSEVIPLLCRVYPNGLADVNHFHAAGGMGFLIRELSGAGLLHQDVETVAGAQGMRDYTREPTLKSGQLHWQKGAKTSGDEKVLAPVARPFRASGGLKSLSGNLGRAVIKVSAVAEERHIIAAPARVFHDQPSVKAAFDAGELDRDVVAIVRFQGPKANGMPELHKLTPYLGILQDRGFKVALVTDGRMSGASGKVPAAIHVTPEAKDGGLIARIQDGDMVRLDAVNGTLDVLLTDKELERRIPATADMSESSVGVGRELFQLFRDHMGTADQGAAVFGDMV